jgi:MHS family proline/betaine transporter-like MFS transporter
VVGSHKKLIIQIMCANVYLAVISYIGIIYMPIYLSTYFNYSLHQALYINSFSIFILIMLVPIFGWLSDQIGSKIVFAFSTLGFIIFGYLAFHLFLSNSLSHALLGQLIIIFFAAGAMAAGPGMMIDLTPTRLRLSISSIGYNIIMVACGGTAPLIATYLIHKTNNNFAPFYYIAICSFISFSAVLFISKSANPIVEPQEQILFQKCD